MALSYEQYFNIITKAPSKPYTKLEIDLERLWTDSLGNVAEHVIFTNNKFKTRSNTSELWRNDCILEKIANLSASGYYV